MSVAATASSHHVVILFQHYVLIVIKVEQVDGEELVGHAARRLDAFDQFQGVDDGLDRSVVRWPHVLTQGEGTRAFAVVSIVTPGRDDPAGPADLLKVNIQGQALAGHGHTVLVAGVQRAGAAGRWT